MLKNGRHYKYNVIITNKKCHSVNYFEDGVDFYFTKKQFNRKYPNPVKIRYKLINFILGNLMGNYNRLKQFNNVFHKKNFNDGVFYGLHKNSDQNLKNILKNE